MILEKIYILLKENNKLLKELNKTSYPEKKYISLVELSNELNKSNQTIKYHLLTNFEPDKDFKKKNGKIYIDNRIVPFIRRHYEKK